MLQAPQQQALLCRADRAPCHCSCNHNFAGPPRLPATGATDIHASTTSCMGRDVMLGRDTDSLVTSVPLRSRLTRPSMCTMHLASCSSPNSQFLYRFRCARCGNDGSSACTQPRKHHQESPQVPLTRSKGLPSPQQGLVRTHASSTLLCNHAIRRKNGVHPLHTHAHSRRCQPACCSVTT